MKTKYKLEYEVFETKNINNEIKPQIWFAFHGIGQNTEAFKHFVNKNNFKIYSFGLFYHEKNQSELENTRETTFSDWLILIKDFLDKEKINFQTDSINIIGFSLGVRPALQLVSNFPNLISSSVSINKIILIAPETLAISNWYRFGTQTVLGQFLLKKVVSSDSFKEVIISVSSFLFSKNAHKLIRYQIYHGINSLASAWLAYRPFEIYAKDWKKISEKHQGKITIVASENDGFVHLKTIQKFIKKNSDNEGKAIKWILSKSPHARLLKEFRIIK